MLSERLSLKLNSLLRRAGLSHVPRAVLVGVCCICLVLVAVALLRFWPVPASPDASFSVATDAQAGQQMAAEPASIYVDVEGAVVEPGLYELSADARIADAVSAAGGLTDTAARQGVNLAQKLEDGMQVYVPSERETISGGSGATGTAGAAGKVNLNTASSEELQELPGIGPALSQRIIDYRTEHGRFKEVEELKEVSGIGDARFAELEDAVCV